MAEISLIETMLDSISPYVRERHAARRTLSVSQKSGLNDFLTEVDLEVQQRLITAIRESHPDDAIVAEEEGMDRLPDTAPTRCWFIDPIDGTQNFVRGLFPEFGVSVAFAEHGTLRAGGVAMPVSGDLFLAHRGGGATRNGHAMSVSAVENLDEARVDIDFGYPTQREKTLAWCGEVVRRAGQMRCYCAAVVGLCSVACGEADAYSSIETHPWDCAAGVLLIEEAGGTVTDFDGEAINPFATTTSILVSNGRIHDEILQAIVHA